MLKDDVGMAHCDCGANARLGVPRDIWGIELA